MTIRFRCTGCNRELAASDAHAGARMKCPNCGQPAVVPQPSQAGAAAKPRAAASDRRKPPEEDAEPLRLRRRRMAEEEIDMTPMIDCVFLLLIFFLVTASFALQKSLEMPPPDRQESSTQARTYEEIEQDDDFVIVRIDKDSTVWVNESEAPSRQDLLLKLREARKGPAGSTSRGPSSLLVVADGDARHETVVMALDAGNAVGMESVRLASVDEEDL
ncbi:MAG: biopolymer transporter ExbD [Planctomycetota bacterium]